MDKHFSVTASDTSMLDADIIKQVVFGLADSMLDGIEAVVPRTIPGLDYKFSVAEQNKLTPESGSEGAVADYQNVTWFDVQGSLDKYQTRLLMTDESKARQLENTQVSYSLQAAAEGLAYQKDSGIFSALSTGAGLSGAATATWDDQVSADPAQDISTAIGSILSNTTIPTSSIPEIKIFYPVGLYGHMHKPIQVGEIQESLNTFSKREFSIEPIPTRQLSTTALVALRNDRNAILLTHDESSIRGAEVGREEGVGDYYIFTQFFKTVVLPAASGGSTNNYIYKITGVDS